MQTIDQPGSPGPEIIAAARRFLELLAHLGRHQSLRDPIAALCEEGQLTAPQLHAVLWLGLDGSLTMGDLARRIGVTEKTITGLVDRLAGLGYAERTRSDADRRVVRAQLTAQGAATYRELDGHLHQRVASILGRLDAQDRADLFRILEKLAPEGRTP